MIGIYVHIPFCQAKCAYCDFLSFPQSKVEYGVYVDALLEEASIYQKLYGSKAVEADTLFIGGGTPSLLGAVEIARLLKGLRAIFALSTAEITIEANPGTLHSENISAWIEGGVNRVSMGAQAFDDSLLEAMGRIHLTADITAGIKLLRKKGLKNLSIDLIFGLPEQSIAKWESTLRQAIALELPHYSVYELKIEQASRWGRMGILEQDEDVLIAMRELTNRLMMQASRQRYEISNYALVGVESQHNLKYWQGKEYVGLGLGASSRFADRRYQNTESMNIYFQQIKQNILPVAFEELMPKAEERAEYMFMGLRKINGISYRAFAQRFGVDLKKLYFDQITKLVGLDLINLGKTHICLTEQGINLSNQVFLEFLPE
ncbi:MAG: radical SAM family heme chaperone HemW [Clostridia bacterium]